MGLSGRIGAGAAQGLEELLASALQEEMLRADQAQQNRQLDQSDRQIGQADARHNLDLQQFEAQREQGERALKGQQADLAAKAERAAYEDTARANMSELGSNPQQLAAFSLSSGVELPKNVIELLTPKKDPEADRAAGLKDYEDKKRIDLKYREPRERQGTDRAAALEDYEARKRIDQKYGPSGGGQQTGPERQRQERLNAAEYGINQLREMSKNINTDIGLKQRGNSATREAKAWARMDPEMSTYKKISGTTAASLAVAIMGAQNLSERDRAIWEELLPDSSTDKDTAEKTWNYLDTYMRKVNPPSGAVESAPPPADLIAGVGQLLSGGQAAAPSAPAEPRMGRTQKYTFIR